MLMGALTGGKWYAGVPESRRNFFIYFKGASLEFLIVAMRMFYI